MLARVLGFLALENKASQLVRVARIERSCANLMKRWEQAWGYHPLDEHKRRVARDEFVRNKTE